MKELILKKAIELIEKKGVKFTTDDLARELETSKRSIYKYFNSKEILISEIIDYIFEEINEHDNLILNNKELCVIDKLKLSTTSFPKSINIGYLLMNMNDLDKFYPRIYEKVNKKIDDSWDVIISLINEGVNQGKIKNVNTSILKVMHIESLKTLIDYNFLKQNNISFEEALKSMTDILLSGILE